MLSDWIENRLCNLNFVPLLLAFIFGHVECRQHWNLSEFALCTFGNWIRPFEFEQLENVCVKFYTTDFTTWIWHTYYWINLLSLYFGFKLFEVFKIWIFDSQFVNTENYLWWQTIQWLFNFKIRWNQYAFIEDNQTHRLGCYSQTFPFNIWHIIGSD